MHLSRFSTEEGLFKSAKNLYRSSSFNLSDSCAKKKNNKIKWAKVKQGRGYFYARYACAYLKESIVKTIDIYIYIIKMELTEKRNLKTQ